MPCEDPRSQELILVRRQNRLLTALLIIAVAGVLSGATTSDTTIRASSIQLIDANGSIRAELGIRDGSPGLFIVDENGVDRIRLVDQIDGTGLYIQDESGTTRLGAAQFAHGGGGFALHGPESKGAAVLYLKNQGSLRFFDSDGNVTRQILSTQP